MKKILTVFLFMLLYQCGYQVVNYKELNKFNIKNLETTGEKEINFKLRRNLLFYSNESNEKKFDIKIKTSKTKSIKEKNINNQISKYNLTLSAKVEFYNFKTLITDNYLFTEQGSYSVDNNNIDTRNKEKKVIDNLVEKLSEKIIKRLRTI